MDHIITEIFDEYLFIVILILCEKFDENFRIHDVRLFINVIEKYVNILKPRFSMLFNEWRERKNLYKLKNKMINATLEDIYTSKDDDFKNVFRILKYLIAKQYHYQILEDLLKHKIDKKTKFKVNIGKCTLNVKNQ